MNKSPMEEAKKKTLWKDKRVKTPTVLQMEATECGAASLSMILSYHKSFIPLEQLRADCGVSRDGSNAFNIVKTARKYGLDARGFSIDAEDLNSIQLPMILHWNFNHFLVLEGKKGNTFYLNDPDCGQRTVSMEEFDRSFTGLALQFIPGANFHTEQSPDSIFRALISYFKKSRTSIFYIFLCSILLAIPGIMIPSLSMVFVDRVLGQKTGLMLPLLIALGLAVLMKAYITWLQRTAIIKLSVKFLVSSAAALFEHILRLPAEFYHQRTPGELQYRLTLNNHLTNLVSGPAGEAFTNFIMASLFLIVMFQYDIPLALAGVFTVSVNLLAIHILNNRKQTLNQTLAHEKNKLFSIMTNGVRTIETIKASAADFEFFSKWAGHQARKSNAEQKIISSNIYANSIPELLLGFNNTAILTFGAWRVINGDISMGMLVAFQGLMGGFLAPAAALVSLGAQIQNAKESFKKINDILRHKKDIVFESSRQNENLFLEGELELKNITYGYSPLSAPVIKDFSLHLKPGSRIGLTGRSGAGKSTIAKLAAGLYRPLQGEVLLDGKPLLSYTRECLENSLAMVEQNPILFSGTVRDNLSMWNPLKEDKDLTKAAINADIHKVIMGRTDNYNADIKEGGQNFSGGERQRLEIARALTNNPALLILDEATSALDDETEKTIDANIRKCGCSCLIISQRPEALKNCDEIIVIDDGKIVQKGKHDDLMKDKNGIYAKLAGTEN